jgi:outer membrane lipoprotein-sorting protein
MIYRKVTRLASTVVLGVALAMPIAAVFPFVDVPFVNVKEAAAARPKAAEISGEERAAINRIEQYLNGMTTLQARFLQASSNGQFAEGNLYISRPDQLRIEYDPPVPVLIVTSGRWLVYYDKQLQQVSHIPLRSTPASILTRPNISLLGGDLILTDFESKAGTLRVTLVQASDPYSGKVSLVFDENPMALRKWTVVDAQGIETDVSLVTARFDEPLDRKLFQFRDPRIFQDGF